MTSFQFHMERASSYVEAGLLTLVMGALVELGEGRMRDLVPDLAGALLGAAVVSAFQQVRSRMRAARGKPAFEGFRHLTMMDDSSLRRSLPIVARAVPEIWQLDKTTQYLVKLDHYR
jgi:hypothetical protein